MITLRLLGGARLEGEGGTVTGEPAQRHRIALLSLLALADGHHLPREKALGLLWPEHRPRETRHLLNVAVYVLRKALGKRTILSEGDALRLDLESIRCDVVDFRRALDRGELRTAVGLYGGPFLDGFFLEGSNPFNDWQEARARELETRYVEALRTLSAQADEDGDRVTAVRHLRDVLRLRPADTAATVALMRLLERSGDRVGALAAARQHDEVLARSFDAEPSPDVKDLARRIREEPRTRVRPARSRAEAPEARAPPGSTVVENVSGSQGSDGQDRTDAGDDSHRTGRLPRGRFRRALGMISVLLAVSFLYAALRQGRGEGDASLRRPPASVAVLPLADLSPASDHAYLGDGLTEALLTALAQTPGLTVAARSSAFRFRGEDVDVRRVGETLDVATVVQGSIQVIGDRLRLTVRLVDAETGHQLWADRYDRRIRDVFDVQEELARDLATELSAEIAGQLPDTLVPTTTRSAAAYRLYLRGRYEWRKRTEEGMWSALDAFQQAVTLDPGFAGAYAGLADTWQLLPDYGDVDAAEGLARAKTAALRAVALDSTLAEAHVALAALLDDYDRDREGAEAAYRKAIELNPGYATARHWLAIHLADAGRFDEALRQIEIARRLDPLSDIVNTAAGAIRYFARDYPGAIAEYRAVLDVNPDFALGWALLGRVQLVDGRIPGALESLERAVELSRGDPSYRAVYATALAAAGRREEAEALAHDLWSLHPEGYVPYCELASTYVRLGAEEEALQLFRQAFEQRDPALKHIRAEPLYDGLRGNPEFDELVRRAGFPAG